MLEKGYTTTQSHNILTYQQVASNEDSDVVLSAYYDFFKERTAFKTEMLSTKYQHLDINFEDMNDGKMVYGLTQHSTYARKYHPFILCRCGRGEREVNCKPLTDNEYEKLQQRSEKKTIKKIR